MLSFSGAIRIDSLGNRVAMDSERFSGVGNPLFVSREGFLNIEFFKLVQRFIQKDVTVEHVFN